MVAGLTADVFVQLTATLAHLSSTLNKTGGAGGGVGGFVGPFGKLPPLPPPRGDRGRHHQNRGRSGQYETGKKDLYFLNVPSEPLKSSFIKLLNNLLREKKNVLQSFVTFVKRKELMEDVS